MPTLMALLASAHMFSSAQSPVGDEATDAFLLIAHRGIVTETLVENTLPSLEETIRRGYTHVEVDLRCTKDGHAVCLHDSSLKRTAGVDRNIHDVTLTELRELVPESSVPSFRTYCKSCENRIALMPDLKGCPDELADAFVQSAKKSMTEFGLADTALFIGAPNLMKRFRGMGRECWRRPLRGTNLDKLGGKNPGGRYFVFNHGADFDAEEVKGFHDLGLDIIVSININHYKQGDPIRQGLEHVKQMLALGVDGLQIDAVYQKALPPELCKSGNAPE